MNPDVQQLLDNDPAGLWVALDVVMEALDVSRRRAYEIAREDNWRTRGRPQQYAFADVARSYRSRTDTSR